MTTNKQSPSTHWFDPSGTLRVHSVFATIQGEGPWVGLHALFVRLHGCNLQCPRCDTDYTSSQRQLNPSELLAELTKLNTSPPLLVITGGEPFLQNLCPFLRLCQEKINDTRVQIETNGTTFNEELETCFAKLDPPPDVVCSPKLDRVEPRLLPYITAYKYVVRAGDIDTDGLPRHSLGHPVRQNLFRPKDDEMKSLRMSGKIFLQPEDSDSRTQNQKNLHACTESVLRHGLRLSLQMHKLINQP